MFHDEVGFPTQRLDEIDPWLERVNSKLDKHLDDICLFEEDYQEGAQGCLPVLRRICPHRPSRDEASPSRQGKKVDMLTLLTIWPFPEAEVEALGDRVDRIIVPEMNLGQLALEVERMVGRKKVKRVNRANGEMITPQMVLDAMEA